MCYATDTLTEEWQELPALREKCAPRSRDWLFMRLQDLTERGEIERRLEFIRIDGRVRGWKHFYRLKP